MGPISNMFTTCNERHLQFTVHHTVCMYCVVILFPFLFFVFQCCRRTQDAGGAKCMQCPVAPSPQACKGSPSSPSRGLLNCLNLTSSSCPLCSFTLWGESSFFLKLDVCIYFELMLQLFPSNIAVLHGSVSYYQPFSSWYSVCVTLWIVCLFLQKTFFNFTDIFNTFCGP